MPSVDRDTSRDSDRLALTHRHSASSDGGRAIVPMWDSSDPERAPPPLPMNPSSPSVSTSRGNPSSAIKSAHAALTERARENVYALNPPPKRLTEPSPERLLIKGPAPAHKRMQSLQTGTVRDLSSFIEAGTFGPLKLPEKPTTRPTTPHATRDHLLESPEKFYEKEPERSTTPPKNKDMSPRDQLHVRPSLRRPPQSILGENTPPQSATMQALHNMATRDSDPPLSNVTNGSTAMVRTPQTFDAISNQILSLTSICTSLQREMAQLSRRSKDNATDLVSLKEATNARDEDIRKSLRELVTGLSEAGSESRTLYGGRSSPSSARNGKPFSLPRIPSPNSFAASLDRESIISNPLAAHQPDNHAPTVALVERVLREMGTKEGQELMISRLREISEQLGREGMSTAKKMEELIEFIKEHTEQALVARQNGDGGDTRGRKFSFEDAPKLELDFDRPGSLAQRMEALVAAGADKENRKSNARGQKHSSDVLNDDMLRLIRNVKDSVAQGGGLTAEVKALVRELRGEVLGMGREIGRKLEQVAKDGASNGAEVTGVVQTGLEELKEHMNQLIRESRRQTSATSRNAVDYQEIYNAVRSAVNDKSEADNPGIEKEDILEAIREAWENYKPEYKVEHIGLEKDELLACLKEGLQEYAPEDRQVGASRDEVFTAVIEGLKHFYPPRVENEANLSRDEILDAVRECLEEFEFPAPAPPEPREPDVTREDMVDAVKEGLSTFDLSANSSALSLKRAEMIDAVREGLKHFDFAALNRNADGGITRDDMLTAIREGLHMYGITNQHRELDGGVTRDDVVGAVTESLHTFDFAANLPVPHHDEESITRDDMFEAVRAGLESFEFPVLSKEVGESLTREDVFDAVKECLHTVNFNALVPLSTHAQETGITRDDVFEAVKDGLQTFDSALTRDVGGSLNRDDIFDAVKEGLHSFDSALTKDVGGSGHLTRLDVMEAVKDVLATFNTALIRDTARGVSRDEMIEALEDVFTKYNTALTRAPTKGITREDVVDALQEVLAGSNSALTRETGNGATRDVIFEAVRAGFETQKPSGGVTRDEIADAVKEGSLTRDEVVDAVQEVLGTFNSALTQGASPSITRDDVLGAVKDGFQAHNVNITRDEVLSAVKEGLQAMGQAPSREEIEAITRDDVFDAVKNGFEIHDIGGSITRDDILEAVKGGSITREDILDAVKDGLQTFDSALTRGVTPTVTKADVFEAVRIGLQGQRFPPTINRDDVFEAVADGLRTFNSTLVSVTEVSASKGDVFDAVKEGFETFNSALTPVGVSRDDVLNAVKEGLQTFDSALTRENVSISREDILQAVKEGLENYDFAAANAITTVSRDVAETITKDDIFEAMKTGLATSSNSVDAFMNQVSERLQEILESMRTDFKAVSDEAKQNVAANERDTEQLLGATKDGFEKLRSDIKSYVDRSSEATGKDEILENMRDNFITLRSEVEELISKNSTTGFETVQGELAHLRESIASALIREGANSDKDEILDALKEGLESLRAGMEKPREGANTDKDEILNALKEGLESLRAGMERPREDDEDSMPGTGDIIDALQDGFTVLKAEVEKVGSKPIDMTINHEILDTLKQGLEGLRAELDSLKEAKKEEQALVEINNNRAIVPVVKDNLKRDDIEKLELLITQLRVKVEAIEALEHPAPQPAPASIAKEDLASIEEMLRGVQEKIDAFSTQVALPSENVVRKEDLQAIETLLRNTKAKVDEIDPEQSAKKDDIETMGTLILEARDGINNLTTHLEEVSKRDDINAVETLVRDILIGLAEIKAHAESEAEDLEKVTKTDIEAVEAVCLDVKSAIEQTVVPEFAALATKDDVNNLGEVVKEFKERIETHASANAKAFEERQAETVGVGERVTEIKSFLELFKDAMKEKLDEGATSIDSLRQFLEGLGEIISKNENITDDIKGVFEAVKTEFEQCNAGIVGAKLEVDEKFQQTWDKLDTGLEEKFSELMSKYDEIQNFLEEQSKLGEEKTTEVEATVLSTKQVVDDIKMLVDTLSTTLTESVEKIDEGSKTVFTRVDETFTKVEEVQAESKSEHKLTREEVLKTLGIVEGVQGNVTEYNPQILESIKDVLVLVGQHYEHSKSASEAIQGKIADIPPPPEIPPPIEPEKYDDTPVHEKLDKLVGHMQEAGKSFAQLEMLDKIHQQVMDTASEVSQFVTKQTQRIAYDHAEKERAAEAASIALERRLAQKELVEATVVGLRDEEELLRASIAKLKTEKEDLTYQKLRLTSDVSSLETALRIRREELQAMETRAEGLERRILEGVIDHSRALLLSKNSAKNARDPMSRKRTSVHRNSTAASVASSVRSKAPSTTHDAVNIAMKNRSMNKAPPSDQASRRILSLSQINNNLPNGNFKRSHSVKKSDEPSVRKSSWGGATARNYGELNKENLALREQEHEDGSVNESDGATMRRSSHGTTVITENGTIMTGTDSHEEGQEWTESVDGDGDSETESDLTNGHQAVTLYEPAGEVV